MTALTAEFLHAAATYEPPKETMFMWCPNPYHGQATYFTRISETEWRCPDCGRVVTLDRQSQRAYNAKNKYDERYT